MLGGRIRHVVGAGSGGGDGAVINDAAAARVLVLHEAESRLRAEKGACEIYIDDGTPGFEWQVFDRDARCVESRVIEQDIEAMKLLANVGEEAVDRGRICDVRGDREHPAAGWVRHADRCFQWFGSPSGYHDGVACPLQLECGGAADAADRKSTRL